MKFYKEDEGEGLFSVYMENTLLCICYSERIANVLLRVLEEGLNVGIKEMEADQTHSNTEAQTGSPETTPTSKTTTEEVVNEKSLIKLTTGRNGLQLISSTYNY